jgi:hypothetical protein
MLGLVGFRLLAASDYAGEFEQTAETTAAEGQVRGEIMGETIYDEPSTPGRVLDSASASCQRDVTPSFRNTFRRW